MVSWQGLHLNGAVVAPTVDSAGTLRTAPASVPWSGWSAICCSSSCNIHYGLQAAALVVVLHVAAEAIMSASACTVVHGASISNTAPCCGDHNRAVQFIIASHAGVLCAVGGDDGGFYTGTDVVTLTDSNFDGEVMQSDDIWMVEVRATQ
eukprot:GHUV01045308.1.p1 GENE.GHUV01045308.1~~GHUV01045308.1.p1  ORF type:complete len:150 (-),score=34.30 GHUV01045308.1:267-716(-)